MISETQSMEEFCSLPKIISICAGDHIAAGLDQNGRVWVFMPDGDIVKVNSSNLCDIQEIASNFKNIYALNQSGKLFKSNSLVTIFEIVENLPKLSKIFSSQGNNLCVIDENDQIWAFGIFDYGQVGCEKIDKPTMLSFPAKPKLIASSYGHCVILDDQNRVWARGNDDVGQISLQMRGRSSTKTFTLIPNIPCAVNIAVGTRHTVLLDKDGNLWGFGANQFGQLSKAPCEKCSPSIISSEKFIL